MHIFRYRNNRGFSLLEILVAMTILAVGLLGMTLLIVELMPANSLSASLTTATTLARDQMENIKGLGYYQAASQTENYKTIPNFSWFKRVTNIASDSPASGFKTVTVTVYWNFDRHSVDMGTILTQ